VVVPAERVEGWLERFEARHGATAWVTSDDVVEVTAADGSWARLLPPFPPLPPAAAEVGAEVGAEAPYGGIVGHVVTDRRVGVLLVRLGGHAAGVFEGTRLIASKVGSRQVHGRSSAGGWSQQRFARRREGQVRVALDAAADVAARVLAPEAARLDALVLGGDRRSVDAVLADRRLERLRPLVVEPLLDVPDPRLAVLQKTPETFRAVRVDVVDAEPGNS
jgi:Actinobacteria/chloroflexi VLRF1 release factor